jgi:hypothetical protein
MRLGIATVTFRTDGIEVDGCIEFESELKFISALTAEDQI